ncbi:ComF family protein [Bordetella bronchialis]|nr:ComF family protein [Bordetella bronchialis]
MAAPGPVVGPAAVRDFVTEMPMQAWRAAGYRLLSMIATDCPLCGGPSAGGRPCAGCLRDVAATMHAGQPRCPRCALRLRAELCPCPDCARRSLPLAGTSAGFDYEAPGDMLISRYKVEKRLALAGPLADLILRAPGFPPGGGGARDLAPGTVLVPIPSSRASLRRRGFNPAAELARALARRTGLPVRLGWLARSREGPKQSGLSREARLRMAPGGYACPAPIPPCPIALVDDVMTTGSTLHAAALALRAAGAGRIVALVAARAPADAAGTLAQYRLP